MTEAGLRDLQLFSENPVKPLEDILFTSLAPEGWCAGQTSVKRTFLGISAPCRLNLQPLLSAVLSARVYQA
jgi:hypothetical protein